MGVENIYIYWGMKQKKLSVATSVLGHGFVFWLVLLQIGQWIFKLNLLCLFLNTSAFSILFKSSFLFERSYLIFVFYCCLLVFAILHVFVIG